MDKGLVAALAVVLTPVLIIVVALAAVGGMNAAPAAVQCGIGLSATTVDGEPVEIGGWDSTQVANAMAIMNAAADLDMSRRDQEIAVTTAIGESTLRVLDHGDQAGPDSRGLFQQRDNGAWGTYEDRMDPYRSATNFLKALKDIENRDSLSITEAAHRVQGNANPNHYADSAVRGSELVTAILEAGGSYTVGEDSASQANCAAPAGAEGIPDQGTLGEPSTDIACPEGSTDLGIRDGAYQGSVVPIRLCSIAGTTCTGSDCRAGDLGGLARGEVVINARFAPYFQAWLSGVREQGHDPSFSSSFRSWESQRRISGGGSNSNAAGAGKSHHQTGAAVDVSGLPGSYNKHECTGTASDGACMASGALWTAMHAAGLQHGMTVHDQEFWHFEFILSGDHRGRPNPFAQL